MVNFGRHVLFVSYGLNLFFNYIIITLNLKNYSINDYQTLNK